MVFAKAPVSVDSKSPKVPNANLEWLAGCWKNTKGTTIERWTISDGSYLLGVSVTMKQSKVVFFEHLRIEPGESGPVLQAYPKGVGPTSFLMTSSAAGSISFANSEHDYPQRISYARKAEQLIATISRMDGSDESIWKYHRCN